MKTRLLAASCFAAALLVAWSAVRTYDDSVRPRALSERLLGPVADIAATIQWVRFDEALGAGRLELADARARLALDLAPGSADGWNYYADNLIYNRASPQREPDRTVRERWVRAGLSVLDRGERSSRNPGRVAFHRGTVFLSLAQVPDAVRPLPISKAEAWSSAADAFERAAAAGEPLAAEAARAARREAGQ